MAYRASELKRAVEEFPSVKAELQMMAFEVKEGINRNHTSRIQRWLERVGCAIAGLQANGSVESMSFEQTLDKIIEYCA